MRRLFCLLGIRVKFQKLSGFIFCACSSSSLVGIEFDPIALERKCLSSRPSRALSPCAHTPPNNTPCIPYPFGPPFWAACCVCVRPAHHCVQIDPLNYHPFFSPGPKINRGRGFSPLWGGGEWGEEEAFVPLNWWKKPKNSPGRMN